MSANTIVLAEQEATGANCLASGNGAAPNAPASGLGEVEPLGKIEPFFCHNAQMRSVRSALKQIALSDVPVVLRGESGVGKEVLAREIHALSRRADKPFLKLNCAALPQELLESELFGYERGAFTGAVKSTPGKFEVANGGMILLDEIGDLDIRLQAKLLHVLQDNEFQRLGGRQTIRVNVRVLAATHCDLEKAIEEKRFREDLYYRLNVVSIQVPPLRERKDEIPAFARLFLEKHAMPGLPVPAITPALSEALLAYHWPGNIRELENVMRRLLVFGDADLIAQELWEKAGRPVAGRCPPAQAEASPPEPPRAATLEQVRQTRAQQEAGVILEALAATGWSRKKAARLLNIDYKGLLYKMKKLGLGPGQVLPGPAPAPVPGPAAAGGLPVLAEVARAREQEEARVILDALAQTQWSRKRAARLLKTDYRSLLYRMKKLGIGARQPERPEPQPAGREGRLREPLVFKRAAAGG
jgi:two-component system response regulator AtoC